ncbi:hypothetical protein CS063_12805 [Sporanaerobium hydrogeniformans]|uniref:Uncharacterized protein n=1 Tax=Sporanaerobium hydrogeniformans TaxID=3072179 RepID=A0AC61D9U3_9FIRM|nr:histidine kinase [Sporanaerobium hydrogeniformans]PHV70019.1 hypothetical protein CS063_12805 [Sporanaerobium hydrogeniformans]
MICISILWQLIMSIYTLYTGKATGTYGSIGVMGAVIVHLLIYLTNAIIKREKMHQWLYSIDCLFLLGAVLFVHSQFGLLLVTTCLQMSLYKEKKWPIGSCLLFIISYEWVQDSLLGQQFIFYVLTILALSSVYYYERKVQEAKKVNEEIREKLYCLQQKLIIANEEAGHIREVTKVQERNILAQKLHDKLGHVLSANIMQLEAVKLVWMKEPNKGKELLESSIHNLRMGMDDIRLTLRSIKPEQAELGLSHIKKLLEELKYTQKIKTSLEFAGDMGGISPKVWYVIGQNLQEAITNLIKYSKADSFKVKIEVHSQIIRIQFKDNGRNIMHYKKGMGLIGMEERLQALHGKLIINTEDGFEIIMIIERREENEASYSR